MDAFPIYFLLILVHAVCIVRVDARYYYSGGTGSWLTVAIVLPVVFGFIILVGIMIVCKKKCAKNRRTGDLTSTARYTDYSNSTPDSYEMSANKDAPPYGHPPPYEQPPAYRPPSAPIELFQATPTVIEVPQLPVPQANQ